MRCAFLSAAILLVNSAPAFGQERNLRLTTNIISQRFCIVNSNVDALQLTLQLRYTNFGTKRLILYKGNRLFYQVFISRSSEEAATRKYESYTTDARYFDEQPEKIDDAAPGRVFTVLPPGASYQTKQVVTVPVVREGGKQSSNTLAAGEHVLHLAASTWYESKKLAEVLRERWRARGLLWSDTLASDTIKFDVARVRSAITCQ